MQLYAAGTRVRLVAERVEPSGEISQRVQADVRKEHDSLRGVAQILFPEAPAAPARSAAVLRPGLSWPRHPRIMGPGSPQVPSEPARSPRLRHRISRLEQRRPRSHLDPAPERIGARSRKIRERRQGLASNLLFGAAAALITGGVVYLITE